MKIISVVLVPLLFAANAWLLFHARHVRNTVDPLVDVFMSDMRNAAESGALKDGSATGDSVMFSYEIPEFVCEEFIGHGIGFVDLVIVEGVKIRNGRTPDGEFWHAVCDRVKSESGNINVKFVYEHNR